MLWTKETRAWSLFKGIVILVVASVISQIFNLYAISYLTTNMFSVGILAIIVIFQPELRRALEQIGKGRFVEMFVSEDKILEKATTSSIDHIILAVKTMAKSKTGALILIEGEVALGELKTTGTTLDALISSQLLLNIFVDKTPMHDGAVIISNNRIVAASCILPLTQSELSADLGTRHRAAVGASEISDASVVVVSEETGHISVANGGKLFRNLEEKALRDMLVKGLLPTKRNLNPWKGKRRHNG